MAKIAYTVHKFQAEALRAKNRYIALISGIQGGKGLEENEPVLTPKGFRPIKEIREGDTLFDDKGSPTKVLAVFDRGEQKLYRLTFDDSTSILTDGDHLWKVKRKFDREKDKSKSGAEYWTLMSTADIFSRKAACKKNYRLYFPLCHPIKFRKKALPLDPYRLGALIGDGSLRTGVRLASADMEIVGTFSGAKKVGNSKYNYGIPGMVSTIRELGLFGKLSKDKFIPFSYLISDVESRISLLQGLMDTDGWVLPNKEICFSTSSDKLAYDFGFLVQSLGGKYRRTLKKAGYKKNGVYVPCLDAHVFRVFLKNINPFRLERKAGNFYSVQKYNCRQLYGIEEAGTGRTICIKVDSPSELFITKNFLVTHNTTAGAMWLAKKVNEDKSADYLVAFPTYRVGKQSTLKKFRSLFPKWGEYIMRDDEYRIKDWIDDKGKKQKGGKIYFRSCEDPTKLEGITARAAWVDEAGQISSLAWETIQARLSIAKGQCLLTTTPYSMNWLYRDFVQRWKDGDTDYLVIQFSSADSKWFPKEVYEKAKQTMDPRRFRMKYQGEFTRMDGLVYPQFDQNMHVIKSVSVPPGAVIKCGFDYGFKAPACILWSYVDKEGRIVVFKEFYKNQITLKRLSEILKQESPRVIYVDPSAKGQIEELSQVYGVSGIAGADNNINSGVARLQSLFARSKLLISAGCKNLISELEMYRYAEDRDGQLTDKPLKKMDHAMDALRYMVHSESARPALVGQRAAIFKIPLAYETQMDGDWGYGIA